MGNGCSDYLLTPTKQTLVPVVVSHTVMSYRQLPSLITGGANTMAALNGLVCGRKPVCVRNHGKSEGD
jgi:hypothetical protein